MRRINYDIYITCYGGEYNPRPVGGIFMVHNYMI